MSPAARWPAADRFCDAVDAINAWTGLVCGFAIAVVTAVVIWEVVARGAFGHPAVWANETTVYLSAVAYLVVAAMPCSTAAMFRIDVIYERLAPRTRAKLDLFTFVFFVLYAGTLVWIGWEMAWASVQQGETTGTPWNPPIWPVKLAIPVAGLLLLLQGVANLLRDLGSPRRARRNEHRAAQPAVRGGVRRRAADGLPLAFATGAVAVVFALFLFGVPGLTLIISRVFTLMGNYVLVSVPLFIFMACILERAGVAEAIFRTVYVWSGRLRGGLAVAVIISCALMAAMVGVIGAEIVTMGVVALPAMPLARLQEGPRARLHLRRGRARDADPAERGADHVGPDRRRLDRPALHGRHRAGLAAGRAVHRLHRDALPSAAGDRAAAERRGARDSVRREGRDAEGARPADAGGVQRPRLALSRLGDPDRGGGRRRDRGDGRGGGESPHDLANLKIALADTAKVSAMLYWLFFGSSALIGVYTLRGRHQADPGHDDRAAGEPDRGHFIAMQIVWIILGCFIDWIGILLLTAPIFVPVAAALGFDLVWLGVLFCMNMQISYISPPFGPAAFYLKGVTPKT